MLTRDFDQGSHVILYIYIYIYRKIVVLILIMSKEDLASIKNKILDIANLKHACSNNA